MQVLQSQLHLSVPAHQQKLLVIDIRAEAA